MPTNIELSPKHFPLLRLAKLRNLTARRIGEGVYAVPSHTRKSDGIEWVVTFPVSGELSPLTCSCPAAKLSYCTHRAAAVERYFIHHASPTDYGRYSGELIADRAALRSRILSDTLTRNDKTYLRFCVKFYQQKRDAAKVPAPAGIRRVESRGGVKEFVGGIQI